MEAVPLNKTVTCFGVHSSGSEDLAHIMSAGSQEDLGLVQLQGVLGIWAYKMAGGRGLH